MAQDVDWNCGIILVILYYVPGHAGLTPASEELKKLRAEGTAEVRDGERDVMADRIPITDEEIYEEIDSGDLGLDWGTLGMT